MTPRNPSLLLAAMLLAVVLLAGPMLATSPAAWAVQPDEILDDPGLESRARSLSRGLRCLVCQNQSIDDSDAPLARDLRLLVRDRLVQGDDDDAVRAYVVARYGEYVLLRPPFSPSTWALWLAPPAILLLTGGAIGWRIRRRRLGGVALPAGPAPLTPAETARLAGLLDDADRHSETGNAGPGNPRPGGSGSARPGTGDPAP